MIDKVKGGFGTFEKDIIYSICSKNPEVATRFDYSVVRNFYLLNQDNSKSYYEFVMDQDRALLETNYISLIRDDNFKVEGSTANYYL